MEGMSLKLTPVVVRRLGPLSMFGPMATTASTHNFSPNRGYNPPLAAHPPPPLTPPPSHQPISYTCHLCYYSGCEKVAKNLAVLSS